MIIKWAILGSLFAFFMLWFIGGYIHAKRRLKAGKPLLAYHRVRLLYSPHPSSVLSNTTSQTSSSSLSKNASATAKHPKTTSPSTQTRTPTRAAHHTNSARTAAGPSLHHCTTAATRHRNTLRRRARQRLIPTKAGASRWRCRSMEDHRWRWGRSRVGL
jgi:hypothetical protein